jgi:hypothetical protein
LKSFIFYIHQYDNKAKINNNSIPNLDEETLLLNQMLIILLLHDENLRLTLVNINVYIKRNK